MIRLPSPDKHKALLSDLGKATMRGVRKCSACGTYNGTRGLACKNKNCNLVFKESGRKRPQSVNSVKIVTGTSIQAYSVRLRDRGPDYRGFVQLPIVEDEHGNRMHTVDPRLLASSARCYVDLCERNTNDLNVNATPCPHIKMSLMKSEEATPLTLKNSVLNSLQVSNETKQDIWLLATGTAGPLVQRVTKNVMVVKCKQTVRQPLGFLHFTFYEASKNRTKPEYKFFCNCMAFKQTRAGKEETGLRRCVHFYACICAFASDEKLTEEFKYYINLDAHISSDIKMPVSEIFDNEYMGLAHIIDDDGDEVSAASELMAVSNMTAVVSESSITDHLTACDTVTTSKQGGRHETQGCVSTNNKDIEVADDEVDDDDTTRVDVVIGDDGGLIMSTTRPPSNKRAKQDEGVVQASTALMTLQEKTSPKKSSAKPIAKPLKKPTMNYNTVNENDVSINFHTWLASVTERINQTMHYQFSGKPDPLVFHVHQPFFDCLAHRISRGYKKRRLPNSTTAFIRRDALPLGTFTKYTWQITSILHVKQIFDTPQVPLQLTRSFVENADGSYDLYEPPPVLLECLGNSSKSLPIRPFELKTYLKVGNTSPHVERSSPFVIEWIPDILPTMHIGELRITFEYGHQRNGIIEHKSNLTLLPTGSDLEQIYPATKGDDMHVILPADDTIDMSPTGVNIG